MIRLTQRHELFNADFDRQYRWYLAEADEAVAGKSLKSVQDTLTLLATQPDLGRRRTFRHPKLQGSYSAQVRRPFQKILIFYRATGNNFEAWRLMHGARNLSRRLVEPVL